jgi:hypothetical protein
MMLQGYVVPLGSDAGLYRPMDDVPSKPPPSGEEMVQVLTPCITRNGKTIWHPKWFTEGKVFCFWVPLSKYRGRAT